MKRTARPITQIAWFAGLAMAVIASIAPAQADDGRRSKAVPLLPQYQQECASCHVAYPPGLLPAQSWQRLMDNLPRHFGADASLDPATTRTLSAWLAANAASGRRAGEAPPQDRITRSAWFVREHDEVPRRAWASPAVKSAANCSACHGGADQGNFNEHDVRIPR